MRLSYKRKSLEVVAVHLCTQFSRQWSARAELVFHPGNPYASGATNIFNATIYSNTGGNLDTPPITTGVPVGTADILFQSCHNATLNYRFNDGRVGQIPLDRLTANTSCTP